MLASRDFEFWYPLPLVARCKISLVCGEELGTDSTFIMPADLELFSE